MASIISGNSLGISNSSLFTLGQDGATGEASVGRAGEKVYVNSATGNLVIQNRDELLVGLGPDIDVLRTYNSQGQVDGDNNDNWRIGLYRQVVSGAGNTAIRTAADGAQSTYAFDAASGKYINHDGDGAYDTLSLDQGTGFWTWTDGTTGAVETYDSAHNGRLTQVKDTDGNAQTYFYNSSSGLLQDVQYANGQRVHLEYAGTNLVKLETFAGDVTLVRTRYTYDSANRLATIETDLSPNVALSGDDTGATADGKTYTVTYAYVDGTSHLVSSMTQTDGTSLSFTYDNGRIASVTDALGRVTSFDYFTGPDPIDPQPDPVVTIGMDPSSQVVDGTELHTAELNLNASEIEPESTQSHGLDENAVQSAGWQPTALLETGAGVASQPVVKFDSAGNGFAVWAQGNDVIARRYVDNVWTAPVVIDSLANAPSSVTLSVDVSGNAVATWVQLSPSSRNSIYVARYVSGAWQSADLVSSGTTAASAPSAAINASGKVIVKWTEGNTKARVYTPGSGWAATEVVSTATPFAQTGTEERTAIDANGNAIVAWGDGGTSASVRIRNANGTWQSAVALVTGTSVAVPMVSLDSSGNGLAVWAQGNNIFARRYVGGVWLAAVQINASATSNTGFSFHLDSSGNAIVAWVGSGLPYAARFVSGSWLPAEQIMSVSSSATVMTSAGINAQGQAVVTWTRTSAPTGPVAARYVQGQGWVADLMLGGSTTDTADAAIDGRGNILVASTNASNVNASTFDGNEYYTVVAGDTWATIAQKLYGTDQVATSLQAALGNPSLTAGKHLVGPAITPTSSALNVANAVAQYPRTLGGPALTPAGWLPDTALFSATNFQTVTLASGPIAVWVSGADIFSSSFVNGAWSAASLRESSATTVSAGVTLYSDGTDAIAIWVQGGLYAARYTGGAWQAAELINSTAPAGTAFSGAISNGKAVVTWQEGASQRAYAKVFNAGAWGAKTSIDTNIDSGGAAANKRAVIDASGKIFVTWNQKNGAELTSVYVNVWQSGAWGGATLMDSTTGTVTEPQIARDSSGQVDLVWMQGSDVIARSWNGSAWGPEITLDTGSTAVNNLNISDDPNALVTWDQNGSVYMTRFDGATSQWLTPTLVGSGTFPAVSSNGSVEAVAWWSGNAAKVSMRTNGGAWSAPFTAGTIPGTGSRPDVAVTASGKVVVTWVNAGTVHTRIYEPSDYYTIPNTTNWSALATLFYGSSGVAAQLQAALGNPPTTAGTRISGFPLSIVESIASAYVVQAGDTWADIATYLYGTDVVADELRANRGNVALTAGTLLTNLPSILYDRGSIPTELDSVVPAHYLVQPGDTWASIAQTLFGNADAGEELRIALGSPALTPGAHLTNIPATLHHEWLTPAQPAYIVQAGDSWASIAIRIYGDRRAADALRIAMNNMALVPGAHLIPPTEPITFTDTQQLHVSVTDPLGQVTTLSYDSSGQLTSIEAPPADRIRLETEFAYDSAGNVTRVTNALGRTVDYTYDARGNRISETDSLGHTITRTFSATNRLLTETKHPSAAVTETTRFVYDTEDHLRFTVAATGDVTEYRYDVPGQLLSEIRYTAATYPVGGLAPTDALTEANLTTWLPADRSASVRKDFDYDLRGQIAAVTTYVNIASTGAGIADGTESVTHYVYDQAGHLLHTINARGLVSADGFTASYLYDGLGRLYLSHDALGNETSVDFSDAQGKTKVTLANGLVTTSTYDAAGQLTSVVQSSGALQLGTTSYVYDAAGRLRRTTDPTGIATHVLYDVAGRVVGRISGTGALTEYLYDAAGNSVGTVQYANLVDAAALYSGDVPIADKSIDDIRPSKDVQDRRTWNAYDAAGRHVYSVDAEGFVTQQLFDGDGRVTDILRYATEVDTSTWLSAPSAGGIHPVSSTNDRLTRNFYDADGRIAGTVDGEGYLVEYKYDAAGQLYETIGYATATNAAIRTTGTLAQLRPATAAGDVHSRSYFDASGRVVGQVDGEGGLVEYVYDKDGNRTTVYRYAAKAGADLSTLASARPAFGPEDEGTYYQYDALNRVEVECNPDGLITIYAYDATGNLVSTTRGAPGETQRETRLRYDVQGRLIGELSAKGSAASNLTDDERYAQYGTRYTYDAAGRRTSSIDANGKKTLFYYDNDGRLAYTVDGAGGVQRHEYDAFGDEVKTTRYEHAIDNSGLTGGLAGSGLTLTLDQMYDSVTSALYDRRGLQQMSTDAAGNHRYYTHNAFGELSASAKPLDLQAPVLSEPFDVTASSIETYQYDHRGLLVDHVRDQGLVGLNLSTLSEYDAFGRITKVTRPDRYLGDSVQNFTYDKVGRELTTWIDGVNGKRRSTYDAIGRVIKVEGDFTDPNATVTTYSYDAASRTVTGTSALGMTTRTKHNAFGETIEIEDARGNKVAYSYDIDGNLVEVQRPDESSVFRQYDATGLLIEETHQDPLDATNLVVTHFSYDDARRLTTTVVDVGGLNLTTTTAYDAKGQAVTVTDGSGHTTKYEWTADGHVFRQRIDPNALNLVTEYSYDADGNVLTVTQSDGSMTRYEYDRAGRRVAETADYGGLNIKTRYRYNDRDELIESTDAAGNRTSFVRDMVGRIAFTVNAMGEVKGTTYDGEGRVSRITTYGTHIDPFYVQYFVGPESVELDMALAVADTEPYPADNSIEQRIYDRDGRQIYTVDGAGGVIKRLFDANGNVVRSIAYSTPIPIDTAATADAVAAAIQTSSADQTETYFYDRANRKTLCVDGIGAVTTYAYDWSGNVSEVRAYGTAITFDSQGAIPLTPPAVPAATTADRHERYFYDGANRLTAKVDGAGGVTITDYDGAGRISRTVQRSAKIDPTATVVTADDVWNLAASSSDREVRYFYDAAGRATTTATSVGGGKASVVINTYDAAGRVLSTKSYHNAITLPVQIDETSVRNAVAADVNNDRLTTFTYDTAGHQIFQVDAAGSVVQQKFDALGHVTERIRYSSFYTSGPLPPAGASVTDRFRYDAAGRLAYHVDAAGTMTHLLYDARGNLQLKRVHWEPIDPAIDPALVADTMYDATSAYIYDAANRLVLQVDPNYHGDIFRYDAVGNRTQTISLMNLGGSGFWYPGNSMEVSSALLTDVALGYNDPLNRYSHKQYDAAGRAIYEFADIGDPNAGEFTTVNSTVKKNIYDALGRLKETRSFAALLDADQEVATLTPGASDRVTQFGYDGVGRVIDTADGLGLHESFAFDGTGNKVSYTNKNQDEWTYEYDGFGNLIAEHSPKVPVTGTDGTTSMKNIVTRMEYDAFGQVTQRKELEIDGQPGSVRTTQYEYDRAGRQTKVTYPPVKVFNAALGVDEDKALSTSVEYNALGLAIANKDTAGNYSYKTYDAAGRLQLDIDALGGVSEYTYDTYGYVRQTIRYANTLALTSTARAPDSSLVRPAADSDKDRVIETIYSPAGTLTRESQYVGFVYDLNAGGAQPDDMATYKNTARMSFGDVIWSGDYLTNSYHAISYFYDTAGRKIAQVESAGLPDTTSHYVPTDQIGDGYLTTFEYDGAGNLMKQVEYATPISDWNSSFFPWFQVPPEAPDPTNNRTTVFTYDALGRKLTEKRLGVQLGDGVGEARDIETKFDYDGAGNIVKKTVDGAVTQYYYDAMGRLYAQTDPVRGNGIDSTTITPTTYFKMDAAGNVVERTDYATDRDMTLFKSKVDSGVLTLADDDYLNSVAADRVQRTTYDTHGKVLTETDDTGHVKTTHYDASGRVIEQDEAADLGGVAGRLVTTYQYDASGREIERIETGDTGTEHTPYGTAIKHTTEYNTFGELIARTVNDDPDSREFFDYDRGGRLWRTNAGDGVVKVFFYDLSGGITSQITWAGADGKTLMSFDSAIEVSKHLADMVHTDYRRDIMGRVVDEYLPTAQPRNDSNWVPQKGASYASVKLLESDWDAFFDNSIQGATWTVGAVTFTLDNKNLERAVASWTGASGPESVVVYRGDGPLGALKRAAEIRTAFGNAYTLVFVQGLDNFIPTDYRVFRNEIEPPFENYFNETVQGDQFDWMGGKLIRGAGNNATFIDPDGKHIDFTRDEGPLALLNKSTWIREGWSRMYETYFSGNGGETIQPVRLTTTKTSATASGSNWVGQNTINIDWTRLLPMGSADVQVTVTYEQKNLNGTVAGVTDRSQVFSSEAADQGVTFNWSDPPSGPGGVNKVTLVKVEKWDLTMNGGTGGWRTVFWMEPDAPTVKKYLFSVPVPDGGADLQVLTAPSGSAEFTPAAVVGVFDGRMIFSATVENGNNDFQILYWPSGLNGPSVLHSSGVIDAVIPDIKTLDDNLPTFAGTSQLTWVPKVLHSNSSEVSWIFEENPITSGENETFKARASKFIPANWTNYRTAENALASFWSSSTPFDVIQDWGPLNGKLIKTSSSQAIYLADGKGAFTFSNTQSVMDLAWVNPDMRQEWDAKYNIQFVQNADSLAPAQGSRVAFSNMVSTFESYFGATAHAPYNMTVNGVVVGTIQRIDALNVKFVETGGATYFLRKGDGVLAAAAQSDQLRQALGSMFGVQLTAGTWNPMTITNGGVNLQGMPAGSYQYELIRYIGSVPYGHTVGTASVTPATTAYTQIPRNLGPTELGMVFTASSHQVTWNSVVPADNVEFRYRLAGSTGAWLTAPVANVQQGLIWKATLPIDLATGKYEFQVSNYQGTVATGSEVSKGSGTVAVTAYQPAKDVPLPRLLPQLIESEVLYPPAENYRIASESAGYFYGPPVAQTVPAEDGTQIYNPGYQHGTQINPGEFPPLYGPAITTGKSTKAVLQWSSPYSPGDTRYVFKTHKIGQPNWVIGQPTARSMGTVTWDISGFDEGTYEFEILVVQYDPESPNMPTLAATTGTFTAGHVVPAQTRDFTYVDTTPPYHTTVPAVDMSATFTPAAVTNIVRSATGAVYSAQNLADAGPKPLSISADFGAGQPVIISNVLNTTEIPIRTVHRTYDRWGNVLFASDPRGNPTEEQNGWGTNYVYNSNNQVITETKADIQVVQVNGNVTASNSVTHYKYDGMGNLVAVVDPRSQLNQMRYNAAGQLIEEIHADEVAGQTQRYAYDAFGNRIAAKDSRGNVTDYTYDGAGRLLTEQHASTDVYSATANNTLGPAAGRRMVTYGYDGAGRRVSATTTNTGSPASFATQYQYDAHGNLVSQKEGAADATTFTWDAFGHKLTETNTTSDPVNNPARTAHWDYTPFGQLTSYTDFGGGITNYSYDGAGRTTHQTNSTGQDLWFTYDTAGQLTQIKDVRVDGLNVHHDLITTYEYDQAGNRSHEHVEQDGVVYQDNTNTYDHQGHLIRVVDRSERGQTQSPRSDVNIYYDQAGNRVHIHSEYAEDGSVTTKTVDNWYSYDVMNRVQVENGALVDPDGAGPQPASVQINSTQGIRYLYDTEGNVTSTEQWKEGFSLAGLGTSVGLVAVTDHFSYDQENRRTRAWQTSSAEPNATGDYTTTSEIGYDGLGRTTRERIVNLNKQGFDQTALGYDDRFDVRYTNYDGAGRRQSIVTIDAKNNTATPRNTVTFTAYDNAGNLKEYSIQNRDVNIGDYVYRYSYDPSYRQTLLEVWHSSTASGSPTGSTTFGYDLNGQLLWTKDLNDKSKNHRYLTDAFGHTYARADGVGPSDTAFNITPEALAAIAENDKQNARVQHSLIVNGETLGLSAVGFDPSGTANDVPSVSRFDFGTHNTLGSVTAGTYVLTQTDQQVGLASLKAVAQAVYGDSTLWYVIADANGITSDAQVVAGVSLNIPATSSSRNDSTTFRPYDPTEIKGDTQPALPMPNADGGCGAMGTILIAVVAVIVTIYTAGLAAGALGALEGAVGTTVGATFDAGLTVLSGGVAGGGAIAGTGAAAATAAAIGGAVGSVASQGIAIAAGMQEKFSWKGVAIGAIASAAGSGIGQGFNALSKVVQIEGHLNAAATAFATGGARQGIGIAMGTQHSFNWATVAASAVAAPLGNEIGAQLGGAASSLATSLSLTGASTIGNFAGAVAAGFTSSVAVAAAAGGKVDLRNIAADAFGNALGSALVPQSPSRSEPTPWDYDDAEVGRYVGRDAIASGSSSRADSYWTMTVDALRVNGSRTSDALDDTTARILELREQLRQQGIDVSAPTELSPGTVAYPLPSAPSLNERNMQPEAIAAQGGYTAEVDQRYFVPPGFFSQNYGRAMSLLSSDSLSDQVVGAVGATAMLPMHLMEEGGRALMNFPYYASQVGQGVGVLVNADSNDERIIAGLGIVSNASSAIVAAGVLVPGGVSLRPAPQTAEEIALGQFGGARDALGRVSNQVDNAANAAADASRVGNYTETIRWGVRDVNVREAPPGYWGQRFRQSDPAVNAYELQINPNNESYYLPHPNGGYVQFENLTGNTLQDGKLVSSPNSIYFVQDKPAVLNRSIIAEASRQVEAAAAANLEVEWLISNENAANQLRSLFQSQPKPIPITITHLPVVKK